MIKVNPVSVALVLEYLYRGGELKLDGVTYVWLNNHVVRETETQQWVIDGLAKKLTSYDLKNNKEEPYYMGCKDMTLAYFFRLVHEMPMVTYSAMLVMLREMRDKEENKNEKKI